MTTLSDKDIEKSRYDKKSSSVAREGGVSSLPAPGVMGVPGYLAAPYLRYESEIRRHARPGSRVLDLCSGDGQFTPVDLVGPGLLVATDISVESLRLARERFAGKDQEPVFVCSDAEKMPFASGVFDLVVCAGSLSYCDFNLLASEIARVLKPGGAFVFVDSFNHNPVYRFNRYIHYLRGARSRSTLLRMPDSSTVADLKGYFGDVVIEYYGILAFIAPLARILLGEKKALRFLDITDRRLVFMRNWSFKVVGVCRTPVKA